VGKPEEKRPPERPRHRWEGNIKMGLKKFDGMVWTRFIWLRIGTRAGSCEHGNEPLGSIKG
jgi:hypothetical protein